MTLIGATFPFPSYMQVWSVLDGVIYLVLGVGLLIAKLPIFYAAIGWVLIETPIWTYLNITVPISGDAATLAIIPAIMTTVGIGVAACCAYYVGKAKA